MFLDFSSAAAIMWHARGIASHSERKQPQSRSISLIMLSTIEGAMLRTFLRSARTFSRNGRIALCGMVEEPTLPMKNGSSNSRISVLCSVRISCMMRPRVPRKARTNKFGLVIAGNMPRNRRSLQTENFEHAFLSFQAVFRLRS